MLDWLDELHRAEMERSKCHKCVICKSDYTCTFSAGTYPGSYSYGWRGGNDHGYSRRQRHYHPYRVKCIYVHDKLFGYQDTCMWTVVRTLVTGL